MLRDSRLWLTIAFAVTVSAQAEEGHLDILDGYSKEQVQILLKTKDQEPTMKRHLRFGLGWLTGQQATKTNAHTDLDPMFSASYAMALSRSECKGTETQSISFDAMTRKNRSNKGSAETFYIDERFVRVVKRAENKGLYPEVDKKLVRFIEANGCGSDVIETIEAGLLDRF